MGALQDFNGKLISGSVKTLGIIVLVNLGFGIEFHAHPDESGGLVHITERDGTPIPRRRSSTHTGIREGIAHTDGIQVRGDRETLILIGDIAGNDFHVYAGLTTSLDFGTIKPDVLDYTRIDFGGAFPHLKNNY